MRHGGSVEVVIAKIIRVVTDETRITGFVQAQQVWEAESRLSSGYLGSFVGLDLDGSPMVMAFWSSLAVYENWMEREHDRIATLARSDLHYDRITVTIVE